MTLEQLLLLAKSLAATKIKHGWYARVVELAKKYKILITGEDTGTLLSRFIKRETEEMFEQRVRITQSITPSICGSIEKPFNKVGRNNNIVKKVDLKNPTKTKNVATMMSVFYGDQKSNNKGLDYYLQTRFKSLTFSDPNAWVVVEWDTPENRATVIKPRPFEVSAANAWHFKIINDVCKWLWVNEDIKYRLNKKVKDVYQEADGNKFTMYGEDDTIVLQRVNVDYYNEHKEEFGAPKEVWTDEKTRETYLIFTYKPKVKQVPAVRVGYVPDEWTDGATCVNAFHTAMPYLMKTIKAVSELDLTISLHTFPQKLQYVHKCAGVGERTKKKKCDYGILPDGTTCSACKGTGYKMHTTAQDAILLPMPEDGEDLIDLEKLMTYKSPPIDLVKFQDEYVDKLKLNAHSAVFNTTALIRTPQISKTATEIDNNLQGVYDTLEPYTDKVSEVWKYFVRVFALLAAANIDAEGIQIIYRFPSDFKLKTKDMLLVDLMKANESGAPSYYRDSINNDLAEVMYEDDGLAMRKYKTRHAFFPFNGKTPDEIAVLLSSPYVSEFQKVLYANFEAIFSEIDMEQPEFWMIPRLEEQWEILKAKVEEYRAEIQAGREQLKINFGNPAKEEVKVEEQEEEVVS